MPLTKEQFQKARNAGFTTEQIIGFEKKRQDKFVSPSLLPEADPLLPKKYETEQKIMGRANAGKELVKEYEYQREHPFKSIVNPLTPIVTGLKGIRALTQRPEAAVSNVLMDVQEGKKPTLKSVGLGLSGKRLSELGDLPRRMGLGEIPSSFIGLGSAMGLSIAGGKTLKGISNRLPKIMGKNYTIDRATQAVDALDETRTNLGQNVGEAIKQYSDRTIDINKLGDLPTLPKNVLSALDDPIYQIEKLPDGSIKPTLGNMQKLKEALDDFISSKQWEEATKMNQRVIKQAYGKISQAMKDAAPEIKESLSRYGDFMEIYRDVIKTVKDTGGRVLEKKFRGVFKPGAERTYQIAWDKMTKYAPELKQILKDMGKFTSRQTVKSIVGKGIIGGGALYGLRRLVGNRVTGK